MFTTPENSRTFRMETNGIQFFPLWAINAPLDQVRLRRQLDRFRAAGFDGVVFHPRFYPNAPPYLSKAYLREISGAILHAKSIGLAFWIYDENGWHSGTVGGQLLKKFPADAQRWVELVTKKPERCLAEFSRAGKKWFLAERVGAGVDYFNPQLARHFLKLTHERYRTGLQSAAWQHVEALFCDEPEFGLGHAYDSLSRHGAIPWTAKLPERFRTRYGEALPPLIPQLFFPGNEAAEVRVKFWELLTDILNESFTAPINDWCARHGKLFTAHLKGEEHPLFQVPTSGSGHQFFRRLSLPAIDALERYPANNFYPRQVSSAARQFGNGRCMVEAFGGAGWGATPEDLENYLLWLGRHGLTDFVLHLSQYRLDSAAMHDWPPSQPQHLTWHAAYPEILQRVRRELEKNPRPAADTLVITPHRGIMANFQPQDFLQTNVHNAATYPDSAAGKINRRFMEQVETLHRNGVNYDLADERSLEQFGKNANGRLKLGNGIYRRVMMDDGCRLNAAAQMLVQPFMSAAERIGLRTISEITPPPGSPVKIPVAWKLEKHPVNCLLLECQPKVDGSFAAEFFTTAPLSNASCEIVFADDVAKLMLNGNALSLAASDEGSRAMVGPALVQGANTLRFQTAHRVERPFVWLQGGFRVGSKSPFVAGPRGTVRTNGPFQIEAARKNIRRDFVADGFPFLRQPLTLVATINSPGSFSELKLDGVEADAIRLTLNDRDCGWQWRANGEICFTEKISAGAHRLKIELVPNTFNAFGPHHYFSGDWHVVSPDQIKGRRNFADPADAPANTQVKAWHFRSFQAPKSISLFY